MRFLLSTSQERLTKKGVENYIEYAAIPLNAVGLQALGNVMIPWNVGRSDLRVHKVVIHRDGKTIDVLRPEEVLVLRRENNLEKAMLDGVRTVVVPTKGLQVGDTLNVSFSYNVSLNDVSRHPEEVQTLAAPIPIAKIDRRFLIEDGLKVDWRVAPAVPKPTVTKLQGATEFRFTAVNQKPIEYPKFTPARYRLHPIQVSAYPAWSAVAAQLASLFDKARALAPGSPLELEASKIASSSSDPGDRMLKALRLAQERVRYVALLLGDGAYVPSAADETWERRFGDCKGKTALLLSLLSKLGIEAKPMLVSMEYDDQLGDSLPSLALFDHVIVRARVGPNVYFLDATDYGQRTLEELRFSRFSHGLPLLGGATLERLPYGRLDRPIQDVLFTWDASKPSDGAYPFEATLTLRGSAAATMRAKLAAATDGGKLDEELKNLVQPVSNDDLEIVSKEPENPDGSFVVRFKGNSAMDWSPFEGRKETRFQFNNGTIKWKANFDREKGPNKDLPVYLDSRPFWQRMTETIILPANGKGFEAEAEAIKETVAGTVIQRRTEMVGNRVTTISDFQHVQREISAEEARRAAPVIEKLNEDYAYVVGPPEKRKKAR